MAVPRPKFQVGQLWSTSTGRTVEILAADEIEEENERFSYEVQRVRVIAYKFVGGSVVHLRAVGSTSDWLKINKE